MYKAPTCSKLLRPSSWEAGCTQTHLFTWNTAKAFTFLLERGHSITTISGIIVWRGDRYGLGPSTTQCACFTVKQTSLKINDNIQISKSLQFFSFSPMLNPWNIFSSSLYYCMWASFAHVSHYIFLHVHVHGSLKFIYSSCSVANTTQVYAHNVKWLYMV